MTAQDQKQLTALIQALKDELPFSSTRYQQIVKKYTKSSGRIFAKNEIIAAYKQEYQAAETTESIAAFIDAIRMKPVRTQSGVAPITVLTKPFPCPGKCIFCPNDIRMPKSYLADEPGAQRAERNYFDPYLQTYNRLTALQSIGHTVDKAEIIVLGGTWSFYPESYQIWFITECFRALNDFGVRDRRIQIEAEYAAREELLQNHTATTLGNDPSLNQKKFSPHQIDGADLKKSYNTVVSELYIAPEKIAGLDTYQSATWEELEAEHTTNETAGIRCVGLVIETRPDALSEAEVLKIRRLGCTKTQIGVQSLQDEVLKKNNRGHDVAATRRAFALLRQAGFKIHAHWMANLYGSSVELDKKDFEQLFSDPDFCPDELKVYPCSLISSAELMQYFKAGKWKPYSHDELLDVVSFALTHTPLYCRLTRVIRDIPSPDIVTGNKLTNFRELAEKNIHNQGIRGSDIRAREIKNAQYVFDDLTLKEYVYETSVSTEYFLHYVHSVTDSLAGFLRLSLPHGESYCDELKQAAIVREVHVYGKLVGIGLRGPGAVQHSGLGTRLLERATEIAQDKSYEKLSVISAIGTRGYYRSRGFSDGRLYQHKDLTTTP